MTARDYNKGSWVAQASGRRRSAESVRKLCKKGTSINCALLKLSQTQPGEEQGEADQPTVNQPWRHVRHFRCQRETEAFAGIHQWIEEHRPLKPRNDMQRRPRIVSTTEK